MPLKTRITLLVVAAVVALCAVLAGLAWWRDRELTARYHGSLLQAQQVAWERLQARALDDLQGALGRIVAQPAWERAWQNQDRAALGSLLRQALADQPTWRADVFDGQRALVYSTSTQLRPEPLVEAGWAARALQGRQSEAGLSQVSRERYYLVVAQAFRAGPTPGVLALGLDVSHRLPELAGSLGGSSFLLNLRGREVAGTQPGLVGREGLALPLRLPGVHAVSLQGGIEALAVVQPLAGPDRRLAGALLLLRDVTSEQAADRGARLLMIGVALTFVLVLAALLFFYLRRAMRPLERSVQVLGALSQGDLRPALDEDDQALPDEAGQIARGVEALRHEMLNLQMLRDERTRTRQQQERLIRNQLKRLAESLDESSRVEILAALEPDAASDGPSSGANALAELASILGRMSGLVTTQQNRLIDLLKELREAMERQAMLVSLQQELEIARSIQLSILPRQTPDIPEVEVAALMIPAKEIGGDFYDYFLVDPDHLAVVVADVSGKGIPAAFFMAISRTLLKANALFLREPAQVMERLNDQLCAENEQMMFVTAFLGVLNLRTGALAYVNAGHNPPLLRTRDGGVSLLPKVQNTALAVMPGLPYAQGSTSLREGDTLLMYTDGVTEANDPQGQLFGEARLMQTVRAPAAGGPALPDAILKAVRDFENGSAQADDITCVALRYAGAP